MSKPMAPSDPFIPATKWRAKARGWGKYGKPTYNQATKVVRAFGGEEALAEALGVDKSTVFRWQYARPLGTDGLIPAMMQARIHEVARLNGVLLTPEDWAAERIIYVDEVPDEPPFEVVKRANSPASLPGELSDPDAVVARIKKGLK